jgi:hypothetical protein
VENMGINLFNPTYTSKNYNPFGKTKRYTRKLNSVDNIGMMIGNEILKEIFG